MEAKNVYQQLDRDFITPKMSDDWAAHMEPVVDYLSDNFKRRSMGLVCDFATTINNVYTAVFPSNLIMQRIIDADTRNALLFVHHPSIWDIRRAPAVFYQMDRTLLAEFKKRNIAIYNLHVPLDHFGEYSTSVTLAKALQIKPEKAFASYFGALAGVFGTASVKSVDDLKKQFESAVNHEVSLYQYGDEKIRNGIVAVIAGGGNSVDLLEEIATANVNTLVTGITAKNSHSQQAHDFAAKHRINLLGGTHYSTERFACQAMCSYFSAMGLPAVFIEDTPVLEDQ